MRRDELPGEGRLAHLARAQDPDGRELTHLASKSAEMLHTLD